MYSFVFRFFLAGISTLYLLEIVGLRLSARHIREFSMFSVSSYSKNFLSARCAAAADVACRHVHVFGTRSVSLNHFIIYTSLLIIKYCTRD
jgi:hypothetical protein